MLYHDDSVLLVSQLLECGNEALGVSWVKSDTGFIQNIKGVNQACTEATGEVDPFRLASRKASGWTIQGEVFKTYFDHEP